MKDLSKLDKWQQKKQMARSEDIDRLLTVLGSGLPFRCKLVIDVSLPALPFNYEVEGTDPTQGEPSPAVVKHIARVTGQSEDKVRETTKRKPVQQELPIIPKKPKTKRTPSGRHTKLSDNQVRAVRSLLADGYTQIAVAKKLNIGKGTVSRIKCGAAYKNVSNEEETNGSN